MYFRNDKTADESAYYTAVDSKSAVVNGKQLVQMLSVVIPLKDTKIKSCTDDTRYNSHENAVEQFAEIHLIARCAFVGIKHGKQHSRCDNYTVPIYIDTAQRKSDRIYCEFKSHIRERNLHYRTSLSGDFTTDRVQLHTSSIFLSLLFISSSVVFSTALIYLYNSLPLK